MQITFDRGSLLLSALPRGVHEAELPGVTWDCRVAAFRAPAWRYAEIVEVLRARDVSYSDNVRDTRLRLQPMRGLELRDYQTQALDTWQRAGRRGIVVLPTGSGKTRIAIAAIATTAAPALCLVPTRALLEQWRQVLAAGAGVEVGCLGDGQNDIKPITISTYESAYRHMHRIGAMFGLVVVDEAHHFATGARDEILQMCIAPARLGLTATPPEDEEPRRRLVGLLGPIVVQKSIGDMAGSYLAAFDRVLCRLQLNAEERCIYDEAMERFNRMLADFRRSRRGRRERFNDVVCYAMATKEGRIALAGWRRAKALLADTVAKRETLAQLLRQHRRARVLVFTADNDSAYRISRRELIMPITCDIGRAERRQALAAFAAGRLHALVSSRVLNEGVDVPDADVAIIVGSTLGEREYVQRIGRLLRPAPGKRARIYELVTDNTSEVKQAQRRSHAVTGGSSLMMRRDEKEFSNAS